MVAAAIASRPLPQAPASLKRSQRSFGTWVIIGVPVLLGLLFAWQIVSTMLRTETIVRGAVAVSRVSLEADPLGARVDMVLVDRVGQDTTFNGALNVKLREPDGTVWQTTRLVTPADFVPLQTGGFLAGRVGYSVVVPATDWLRTPRHGGAATVSIAVTPSDGAAFSTVAEERFP
jgi:hypothetical protein